ncbi:MAG: choice-of-anchor B family protein [Chitinophagales bacterium]
MKLQFYILIFLLLSGLQISSAQTEQLNVSLISTLDYEPTLNDIWGYEAGGREYAIVGLTSGVSIVDVTQPLQGDSLQQLFFIPGDTSTWRDMKVFRNYAYVTNEKGGGLQIINLEGLPDTSQITWQNWTGGTWADSSIVYTQAHNIFIDEKGIGYIVGADFSKGGAIMIDIASNPTNPSIVGIYDDFYIHDIYVRGDTMWTAEIYEGEFAVIDVRDKANPITLARHKTSSNFTHNTWMSDDGKTLFTTDERSNAYVTAYDVSDLSDIQELDRYQTATSLNKGVVPHNTFVLGNYLVTSYYTDGITIVDATFPNNLVEVGYYDTSDSEGVGFSGCWGVYPYLSSGAILASDRQKGLFVLQPNYLRASYLEGRVTDAQTGEALTDVAITIQNQPAAAVSTDFNGKYQTGIGQAGLYEMTLVKYGYPVTTISEIALNNGETTVLNLELEPIEGFKVSVQAVDVDTGEPIPDAQFRIEHPLKNFTLQSETSGLVVFDLVYSEEYQVIAGKWGYQTAALQDIYLDKNTGTLTIPLQKGYYDDFTFHFGWTAKSNATRGIWERGESIGVLFSGQYITPSEDVSEDYGDFCYVTGNSTTFSDNVNDGFTTLQSPIFDATILENPELSYSRWFYLQNTNFLPSDDTLYVRLSNGTDMVTLETIVNNDGQEVRWNSKQFLVREFIEPTNTMQLFFEVNDVGFGHLVEAAFDFFRLQEGPPAPNPTLAATVVQGCSPLVVQFHSTTLGEVSNVQWKFEGGDVFITNTAQPTVTYTQPGTYDVTLKVTTEGGTSETTFENYITVLEGTAPELDLMVSDMVACQGETVMLTAVSNESVTYIWTDAAANSGNISSIEVEAVNTATYGVVIMDEEGCTANQQVEIEVPMPSVEVSFPTETICNGNIVQLSILNPKEGYTYFWNGNGISSTEGTTIVATTSIDAPTYTVIAVEPNGCEVIEIIDLDLIVTTAGFSTQVSEACVGEQVAFLDMSENALSYLWEFTNTKTGTKLTSNESNPIIIFEEAGVYNVKQKVGGCNTTSSTKNASLSILPSPEVSINAQSLEACIETGTDLSAIVNGDGNDVTFEWVGEGLSDTSQQTVSAMPGMEGVYEYVVTVTNELGCSSQAISTIDFVICGAVNELATHYALQIFPNPNDGQFAVTMDLPKNSEVNLQLVNVLGQTVQQYVLAATSLSFEQKFSLEDLTSGVYYLVIEVDGQRMLEKVVVE